MQTSGLYGYVWKTSRKGQIAICLLVGVIAPLNMVPLELQRRIVDEAIGGGNLRLLGLLAGIYLVFILVQGALKYILNVTKGWVLEEVCRDLRRRILRRHIAAVGSLADLPVEGPDQGTIVSIVAAESEAVGGFASESLAVPLLQGGTMLWVLGYLLWVQPEIAALAVIIYAPQVILVPRVQKTINQLSRRRTYLVRKLGQTVSSGHTGADGACEAATQRADSYIDQIYRIRMQIYGSKYLLTLLGNFLDALGPIIVLAAGGYMVVTGQAELSMLVVFISGFQRLAGPWDQLVTFFRSVSQAHVAYALVEGTLTGRDSGLGSDVPAEVNLKAQSPAPL